MAISNMVQVKADIRDDVVILFSAEYEVGKKEVVVKVNLRENSGINGATLELKYNKDVFIFNGYTNGSALSKLDLMTTGSETSLDTFKFNWFNNETIENDFGTGEMCVLYFSIKDGITDGEYKFNFAYEKNKDITYVDSDKQIVTKNAAISGVKVKMFDGSITSVEEIPFVEDNEVGAEKHDTVLIVSLSVSGALIIAFITVLIVKIRKKGKNNKKWIKL